MSATQKITLIDGIQLGEVLTKEFTLSEPTPGSLRGLKLQDVLTGDIDALSTLIPRICLPFITPAQFAALSFKDVVTFQAGVIGFLADTPA